MKNSCFKFLTAAAAGTIFATGAFAQGDECATASNLAFDTATAFDTTGATASAPDFSCAAGGGDLTSQDVWFEFTSTADYTALVTTCGTAAYDTKIEVYSGTCGALVSEACNDDTTGCTGFTTDLEFAATTGTQYFVRIGGWQSGDFGTGTVLLVGPPPPPFECADAADIAVDTPTLFDTTGATESAPDFSCNPAGGSLTSPDVWFTFTSTADYMASASTCNTASYDTKIEVYSGSCGALVTEVCNDDGTGCAGFSSQADWMATTGTQYWIRIGGYQNGDFGTGTVVVTGPPPAISNDECAGAIGLASGVAEPFDNTLATNSDGVSGTWSCGGTSGNALDIWYSFTALADGTVDVDTCLSSFDTRLEVYSGDCGSLVSVACNDDNGPLCSGSRASVSFAGTAGTSYIVRVAGFSGGSGAGEVVATYPDSIGNDDCSGAFAIGAGQTAYSNVGATDSGVAMSCGLAGETSDVWYSYTASEDCPVSVDLSGSLYDTTMTIYSGDCMMPVEVACDDDGGTGLDSFISFDAMAGTTYLIQIGGFNGASGDGIITLTEGLGSIVCLGEANSTGLGASLKISGSDVATDNAMTLNVMNLPMNVNLLFVNSREVNFVANPGGSQGNLCIASFDMGRHNGAVMNSGAAGAVAFTPNLANLPTGTGFSAAIAGETWYWQGWYRDTVMGTATSNFSAAAAITFN